MTEPSAPTRRRLPSPVTVRFLAVAVLLAGMAYVTYDTQQQVHAANDDRADLRNKVSALEKTVTALTAENKRLTGLLLNAGIDPTPQPSSAPSPVATRGRTTSTVVRPTPVPRRTTRPAPSTTRTPPAPQPTRTPSARPSPSPTSTCLLQSPVDGRCLAS